MLKNIGKKFNLGQIGDVLRSIRSLPVLTRSLGLIQSRSADGWLELVSSKIRPLRGWVADNGELAFVGGAALGVVLVVFSRLLLNIFAVLLVLSAIWLFIADLGRPKAG